MEEKTSTIIIAIIIVIIIVIIIFTIINYKFSEKIDEKIDNFNEDKFNNVCACVFDIDDTITCSQKYAKAAVEECKRNSCIIAINTARTVPYINDVKLSDISLSRNDIKYFYTGDHDKLNYSMNFDHLEDYVANKKLENLEDLHKKLNDIHKSNCNPKKIILFDDNIKNINKASTKFSVIHANNPYCGLNIDVTNNIKKILN